MIRYGQQALFMCNGLFTSERTLEQVFAQELAFLPQTVGTASGGDYVVDRERRAVAVGAGDDTPTMRAAYREGLGCVMLAPDQTFDDIESLPILYSPPPRADDAAMIAWPNGDRIEAAPLAGGAGLQLRSRRLRTGRSSASRPNR